MPQTLRLVRGDIVLGRIAVKPVDAKSPWRSGGFDPAPEFEGVRDLFEHELRVLRANTNDDPDQWEEWEAVNAEIHEPGLRLEAEDRSFVADEILIHIDGAEAWWRVE